MRLNHNLASLNIYKEYSNVLSKQNTSLGKISSGYKVNSAKDDPNAIAESERLRVQIRGAQMAQRNVQDGISMLQGAEGGLDNITSILQRMRELTVQAGNGTYELSDKSNIQNEIKNLQNGLDEISKNTEFNGVKLISNDKVVNNNNPIMLDMPVGANVGEKISIPMYNLNLGSNSPDSLANIDVTAPNGVDDSLKSIDNALNTVLSARSQYGALENRFESSNNNLDEIDIKLESADSSKRDVDIASEMMEYSKNNILVEAGNALMAQANKFPQDILRILQNVK